MWDRWGVTANATVNGRPRGGGAWVEAGVDAADSHVAVGTRGPLVITTFIMAFMITFMMGGPVRSVKEAGDDGLAEERVAARATCH